jgi:hypothetical protein
MVYTILVADLHSRIDVEHSEVAPHRLAPTRNREESVLRDLILGRMLATHDGQALMPVMDLTGQRVIDRAQAN